MSQPSAVTRSGQRSAVTQSGQLSTVNRQPSTVTSPHDFVPDNRGQNRPIPNPQLLFRPDAARLTGTTNPLPVSILARAFHGATVRLTVQAEAGPPFNFDFPTGPEALPDTGERATLWLEPEKLMLLPGE